ncbi:RidA family protein [Roseiconus nitratireducens]|uniref:RidA family protein n=1 Tax=Roseiconus nitratireducens TaxID=2605748 RepID=A0A5M6CYY3_9BACT|nr:RidA family protein [Roseiconus nitratireducens]KAA5540434.1 RidA family protein [Roseiconus nitratireducens]
MSNTSRLKELGLELPPAPAPAGVYKPVVVVGDMAYVSGHGPLGYDKKLTTGRLGADMDVEAGYAAARLTGLGILATLEKQLGSLDRIERVVKLLGLVRCTDDFEAPPAVINGCSELFREVFGEEKGVGARSALGTNALPGGIAVEIEAIFQLNA